MMIKETITSMDDINPENRIECIKTIQLKCIAENGIYIVDTRIDLDTTMVRIDSQFRIFQDVLRADLLNIVEQSFFTKSLFKESHYHLRGKYFEIKSIQFDNINEKTTSILSHEKVTATIIMEGIDSKEINVLQIVKKRSLLSFSVTCVFPLADRHKLLERVGVFIEKEKNESELSRIDKVYKLIETQSFRKFLVIGEGIRLDANKCGDYVKIQEISFETGNITIRFENNTRKLRYE